VPPIYQPEVIAEAAMWAARHPRRELWIGWSTIKAIIGQHLIPGLLDRYLAKRAWGAQETTALPPHHPIKHDQDNLDRPVPGDRGARGPFSREARSSSVELWARMHRTPLILGAALLACLGVLGARRGWRPHA
jgi:hypothetical protein